MSRNGSGTYSLPAGNPVVSGTTISSTWANNTLSDIATALTASIAKDGQTTPTANLPMGGFKLSGLGAGTSAGHSLRFEQLFSQGVPTDIASASTTDIGGESTNFLTVTGTTTVTSFGTNYNGPKMLRFTGALLLTYNATTLLLPTAANITTTAGDTCIAIPKSTTSGIPDGWMIVAYQRANGQSVGVSDFLNTTRIDVASATTTDLTANAPNTRSINITGTTTITGFTVAIGQLYFVRFNAALTLTNNASIITQTGANITTDAGATCMLRATAGNTVEVLSYVPGAGTVSLSGDQTIAGVKTFSTQPVLPQAPVLGTAVATTSGTSIDFTGIPSWVKKVTVLFDGVSTNGTSLILFRLGAGSAQTTGYTAQAWSASGTGGLLTSGFYLAGSVAAANSYTGCITFVKITGDTWIGTGIHNIDNASNVGYQLSGKVALSGTLDMIRLTTVGGTDTFDAGTCNILYE